jgi:transcription termination factor Rho
MNAQTLTLALSASAQILPCRQAVGERSEDTMANNNQRQDGGNRQEGQGRNQGGQRQEGMGRNESGQRQQGQGRNEGGSRQEGRGSQQNQESGNRGGNR